MIDARATRVGAHQDLRVGPDQRALVVCEGSTAQQGSPAADFFQALAVFVVNGLQFCIAVAVDDLVNEAVRDRLPHGVVGVDQNVGTKIY